MCGCVGLCDTKYLGLFTVRGFVMATMCSCDVNRDVIFDNTGERRKEKKGYSNDISAEWSGHELSSMSWPSITMSWSTTGENTTHNGERTIVEVRIGPHRILRAKQSDGVMSMLLQYLMTIQVLQPRHVVQNVIATIEHLG